MLRWFIALLTNPPRKNKNVAVLIVHVPYSRFIVNKLTSSRSTSSRSHSVFSRSLDLVLELLHVN